MINDKAIYLVFTYHPKTQLLITTQVHKQAGLINYCDMRSWNKMKRNGAKVLKTLTTCPWKEAKVISKLLKTTVACTSLVCVPLHHVDSVHGVIFVIRV